MAGAPADDEERRSRDGRVTAFTASPEGGGKPVDAVRRLWRLEARVDDVDDGGGRTRASSPSRRR